MHTYFISDLHLTPTRPDLVHAFLQFLNTQATFADRLYILGDLFEYWIGDDAAQMIGADTVLEAMQTTAEKVECFFVAGNRDFLVRENFEKQSGFEILKDESVIDLYGEPTLILHGDSLCTDDTEHMIFRDSMMTNRQWQDEFLQHEIPQRIELAMQARMQSKENKTNISMEIMDVAEQAVLDSFVKHNVKQMIHGHTHRQNTHHYVHPNTGSELTRYVMGDWDKTSSVLKATHSGIEIVNQDIK